MNEDDAIALILDDIVSATSLSEMDVRTSGGDQAVSPPEAIVSWSATRLSGYNGANNLGGNTTDGQGNKNGREYHNYYRFEAHITVRSYDELQTHTILTNIQDEFTPYEYDAGGFHEDTAEWAIGSSSPQSNPIFEPDWYEIGFPLTFVLLKRTTESADTLTTINSTDENDMIDISLEDGEVTIGD